MYLKSLKVTDYSTGSTYSYGDKSGSWESIQAEGGKVNGNSGAESFSSVQSAPTVTATVDSIPIPFSGTHRETSSFVTPDIWPWVPTPTQSSTRPERTFPDGWTSSGSGPVQPPSAASVSEHCPNPRHGFVSPNLLLKLDPSLLVYLPIYISLAALFAGFSLPIRLALWS